MWIFVCDSAFGNTVFKSTSSEHRVFVIILAFFCAHALCVYKLVWPYLYSESALFEPWPNFTISLLRLSKGLTHFT
jgi:hypothetical protein